MYSTHLLSLFFFFFPLSFFSFLLQLFYGKKVWFWYSGFPSEADVRSWLLILPYVVMSVFVGLKAGGLVTKSLGRLLGWVGGASIAKLKLLVALFFNIFFLFIFIFFLFLLKNSLGF